MFEEKELPPDSSIKVECTGCGDVWYYSMEIKPQIAYKKTDGIIFQLRSKAILKCECGSKIKIKYK